MTTATVETAKAAVKASHAWRRAFVDLPREHGFEPMRVEGTLPRELEGTLYRNGPAFFSSQGRPYGHWFDGDGAVSAVRLVDGRAEGAVKVVQSRGLVEERAKGRAIYGGYGTRHAGGFLSRIAAPSKNAANTSVIVWQDRLYALWEGGLPTELDPRDLATRGERTLEGAIVGTFSAHPHRVPERKATYNFGMRYGRVNKLDVYELPDAGKARLLVSIDHRASTMIHDFIATSRHLVFFAPPLRMNVPKLLLGLASYSESLSWKPEEGTDVIVVPLDNPGAHVTFTTEAFFQWHFANAFERGEELVVDAITGPDFSSNRFLAELPFGVPKERYQGALTRHVVDLQARKLSRQALTTTSTEFPRVSSAVIGKPYRFTYVAASSGGDAERGLFDRVARVDVESGRMEAVSLGEDTYPSEPVFVRRHDARHDDDGYLLTLVYDGRAHESHVAILDASRLGDGPLARAFMGHHIPFTFHGNFVRRGAH